MGETETALIGISQRLSAQMSQIVDTGVLGPRIHAVYNPLEYAWEMWAAYLHRYLPTPPVKAVFLGMNPGPWGMAQTGIPFGEVGVVRDWLQIDEPIGRPTPEHPKRPIVGLQCSRSEVSGRRLWGLIREQFGDPARFFAAQFVLNYCPLVFMAESGANITPTQLPAAAAAALQSACDTALTATVAALRPQFLVGVGVYAAEALSRALKNPLLDLDPTPQVVRLLHPSPASPAANRGWDGIAAAQLQAAGVWP